MSLHLQGIPVSEQTIPLGKHLSLKSLEMQRTEPIERVVRAINICPPC